MFSYTGRYKTTTNIGQYKTNLLIKFQYNIFRSIYAAIYVIFHDFRLGFILARIILWSLNDQNIETYILSLYKSICPLGILYTFLCEPFSLF